MTSELTPVERLVDPEARLQHALDLGYRYLSRRDRTVLEMRRHLELKRIEPDTIDAALASLAEAGYLDDRRYAERFAEDRRALDDWGADRIARKLGLVGIAPVHVEAVLAARGPAAEHEAARELLTRRFPGGMTSPRERERALGVLVRKGYGIDLAHDAIRAHARSTS